MKVKNMIEVAGIQWEFVSVKDDDNVVRDYYRTDIKDGEFQIIVEVDARIREVQPETFEGVLDQEWQAAKKNLDVYIKNRAIL